jgi:hypothetical protein
MDRRAVFSVSVTRRHRRNEFKNENYGGMVHPKMGGFGDEGLNFRFLVDQVLWDEWDRRDSIINKVFY